VDKFLAKLTEENIHVMIIDTLRTEAEQVKLKAAGKSWTLNSLHLPDETGKSNAIDICPYSVFALYGEDKLQWDARDPVWAKIGELGEKSGLKWGGRWKQKDLGHFEYRRQHA
jgi:hypothetical protein